MRLVAWLMFLPRFNDLCAFSEYRPAEKGKLFVLYNNQDISTHFVSEHRVVWAESNTFQQTQF